MPTASDVRSRPPAAVRGVAVIRRLPRPARRAVRIDRTARGALALLPFALLPLAAACGDRDADGDAPMLARADSTRREAPVIVARAEPYRSAAIPASGTIAGVVRVEGDVPADTTVRPTMDRRACGESFVDRTILGGAAGVGPTVVWLVDARGGKALPLARRFSVTSERCRLEPRVQAVIAGGTLNVRSGDPVTNRTRVVRQGTGEVVARYEHTDFGQVVPDDDVLARPGLLELRSDVHPWTRGFVAVFDHPYFDVTGQNGRFELADVPPGEYTLAAWHERFGRVEQRVTVVAGSPTSVTLTFRPEAPPIAMPAGTPGARVAGEPAPATAGRAEAPR